MGLLSDIDGETMMALEQTATDPALLDRTLGAVRRDRRRTRFVSCSRRPPRWWSSAV
ncbi:hypothetical protein NKG94_23535 [Micromonospora sp. M12]